MIGMRFVMYAEYLDWEDHQIIEVNTEGDNVTLEALWDCLINSIDFMAIPENEGELNIGGNDYGYWSFIVDNSDYTFMFDAHDMRFLQKHGSILLVGFCFSE